MLMVVPALTGCRDEEQDRPLHYEKGRYLGKPGTPLTPEQVEELRQRTANQRI